MDEFDFKEESGPKPPRKFGSALWNIGSLITLIGALCTGGFFTQIFLDPQSSLNPLPPVVTLTATDTPQATATLLVPATDVPTETPTATLAPPTATPDAPGGFFGIQEGSPAALDASVFHPELACNFMGVAGQAFGLDDAPITGLRVQITGTLNNEAVDNLSLTGAATQYGGGAYYEIQLSDAPIASTNTLQIVLLDANGQQVSAPVLFSTSDSCQQNLLMINFKEE
jgi:hypothetical protein